MATRFNSWDSYFWEPGGPVLRNLYGLRDGADLSRREYAETNAQQFDIERGAISIPRTYDAEHLRTIHRELFKNVYEWAGEYRSVGMFKPPLATVEETMYEFGGRWLVHGTTPEYREGNSTGDVVIIAFPDIGSARRWYDSDAYQAVIELRRRNCRSHIVLLEGVPPHYSTHDTITALTSR